MSGRANEKRVVLVTGGSRGIGGAVSVAFAGEGDIVAVNYLSNRRRAEDLVARINSSGGEAFCFQADVSKPDEAKRLVDEVAGRWDRIDVLVNNAGVARGGFLMLLNESAWDEVIDTNLRSVFNMSKAVLPHMIDRKKGVIINVSSLSAITGLAGETLYSAAKGGVISFTKAFAKEVAPFGILVNAVAPGAIETDMTGSLSAADIKRFTDMIPLKRLGRPEEVSGVIRFLASPAASYITGETIIISGGIP